MITVGFFFRNWVIQICIFVPGWKSAKPYQASLQHIAYILQESFKKEFECLQEQQIHVPLVEGETLEWCNSFVLVLMPMVLFFCASIQLMRPVDMGATVNDKFITLTIVF